MFLLEQRYNFAVPVEAECISCDVFSDKPLEEIKSLPVWEGNKRRRLDELFMVEYANEHEDDKTSIKLSGDLGRVRRIGYGMTHGKMMIEGNVGSFLGGNMKGGSIMVHGNTGSWLGSSMRGGKIEVMGDAGDYIAAPYRGSTEGMKSGEITIHGDVGNEAGNFMRGGFIKIEGNSSQFLGIHMRDGTILVNGNSDRRVGPEMANGRIIVCGHVPDILPTFTIDDIRPSVKIDSERINGPFYRFVGDLAENGEGKLFISKPNNPHLSFYEQYLS